MLEYLLKSSACMVAFLLFYQFLLEKENMHQFKRFFLLAALIVSLIIPKLVFTEYVEAVPSTLSAVPGSEVQQVGLSAAKPISDMDVVSWSKLFWSLYFLGVLGFGLRFGNHLYQILRRIRKNPKLKGKTVTKVLLEEQMPPHTFFRYVFLNNNDFKQKNIPDEVLLHEETHARQHHSFDVLFVELAQVILWFNPLLLLFKRNIKLNHEFLADKAVLKEKVNTKRYQNTLLSYLSRDSEAKYQSIKMANAINYSSIKKRFTIMKKQTSKTSIVLRVILLLPITLVLLYGFSTTETIYQETDENVAALTMQNGASGEQLEEYNILAKKYNAIPIAKRKIPLTDLTQLERIYRLMTEQQKANNLPFPECLPQQKEQKGASREQMKEYNALAKKYNTMPKNHMRILTEEVERLEYLYSLMSEKQKADAEPFPNFPEPPMPPDPPTSAVKSREISEPPTPPTPPAPKTPLEHIKEVAQKGAVFYFEGKKISASRAVELFEKNEGLNLVTNHTDDEDNVVHISAEPIVLKE